MGMAVAAVAAGTAVTAGATGSGHRPPPAAVPGKPAVGDRLAGFDGCAPLRRYATARALQIARPYGFGGYPVTWRGVPAMPEAAPAVPTVGTPASGGAAAPATPSPAGRDVATTVPIEGVDFSGTNVQETGVDEPDIVKTDGRVVFTTSGDHLVAVSADGAPRTLGRLTIDGVEGSQLMLVGNRLLVIGWQGGAIPIDMPVPVPTAAPAATVGGSDGGAATVVSSGPAPATAVAAPMVDPGVAVGSVAPIQPAQVVVRMVDVSDPSRMRVLEKMEVEGRLVGARAAGGSVRLVVSTQPDPITFAYPGSPEAPDAVTAMEVNRRALRAAPVRTWLPTIRMTKAGSKAGARHLAVSCSRVKRSREFSGLGTLSVLTVQPDRGLTPVDRDAIMTDGDIVYGSSSGLYVTTPRWADPSTTTSAADLPAGGTTQIHRFDTSDPHATRYRSSGHVPGYLLSQWAMSEKDGRLRVASTSEPSWLGGDMVRQSESMVSVLSESGSRLTTVGRVTGLGRGERIYAVRFMNDTGYVVTFRQTDPLYVVDLSDPTAPAVRGELKIPGYSAYLHPVGDGLLLGVGQDADANGRVTGTQVSLFDVSSPSSPRRVDRVDLDGGWSEVESDHHAFLYWGPTGLAMVPVSRPLGGSRAVGVRVTGRTLTRLAAVTHPNRTGPGFDGASTIRRSLVVDGRLVTVSDAGIKVSTLDTLADVGFQKVD